MPGPERRFRKATIKDVARYAGVSTTTVSVFVSGRETVCSPETADRIRAAVQALNYTPSSLISGAQTKITHTIGVCIPSPLDPVVYYGNPFFERLWRGITLQADEADYSLLHYPASVREDEQEKVDAFLDGRVDGILMHSHHKQRAERLAGAGMPLVLLTRSLHLPDGAGAVWSNEAYGANLALSHLWEQGHRRIAHVAGPVRNDDTSRVRGTGYVGADDVAVRRLTAYTDWMTAHNAFDPSLVFYADSWQPRRTEDIVREMRQLADPPTAAFCANDTLALGILEAARQQGWRVPEALSLVGVDNTVAGRDATPPLTSVEVPLEEIGRESVRCLLRLIQGAPMEECRVALPISRLVPRESVAPRRPLGCDTQ